MNKPNTTSSQLQLMTLIAQKIDTPRTVVEQNPATATTISSPVLEVQTKLIWRSLSSEVKEDVESVLSNVESGKTVSRSPEYAALAMDALLASRNRKVSAKKLAQKLAKDSSQGID